MHELPPRHHADAGHCDRVHLPRVNRNVRRGLDSDLPSAGNQGHPNGDRERRTKGTFYE